MNASELNKKGVELEKKGDYKGALEIITKAIQLDSNNAIYYTNRACVR